MFQPQTVTRQQIPQFLQRLFSLITGDDNKSQIQQSGFKKNKTKQQKENKQKSQQMTKQTDLKPIQIKIIIFPIIGYEQNRYKKNVLYKQKYLDNKKNILNFKSIIATFNGLSFTEKAQIFKLIDKSHCIKLSWNIIVLNNKKFEDYNVVLDQQNHEQNQEQIIEQSLNNTINNQLALLSLQNSTISKSIQQLVVVQPNSQQNSIFQMNQIKLSQQSVSNFIQTFIQQLINSSSDDESQIDLQLHKIYQQQAKNQQQTNNYQIYENNQQYIKSFSPQLSNLLENNSQQIQLLKRQQIQKSNSSIQPVYQQKQRQKQKIEQQMKQQRINFTQPIKIKQNLKQNKLFIQYIKKSLRLNKNQILLINTYLIYLQLDIKYYFNSQEQKSLNIQDIHEQFQIQEKIHNIFSQENPNQNIDGISEIQKLQNNENISKYESKMNRIFQHMQIFYPHKYQFIKKQYPSQSLSYFFYREIQQYQLKSNKLYEIRLRIPLSNSIEQLKYLVWNQIWRLKLARTGLQKCTEQYTKFIEQISRQENINIQSLQLQRFQFTQQQFKYCIFSKVFMNIVQLVVKDSCIKRSGLNSFFINLNYFDNLKALSIINNKIADNQIILLMEVLIQLPRLKYLDLSQNLITGDGLKIIAYNGRKKQYQYELKQLIIKSNKIISIAKQTLVKFNQFKKLQRLNIQQNDELLKETYQYIVQLIYSNGIRYDVVCEYRQVQEFIVINTKFNIQEILRFNYWTYDKGIRNQEKKNQENIVDQKHKKTTTLFHLPTNQAENNYLLSNLKLLYLINCQLTNHFLTIFTQKSNIFHNLLKLLLPYNNINRLQKDHLERLQRQWLEDNRFYLLIHLQQNPIEQENIMEIKEMYMKGSVLKVNVCFGDSLQFIGGNQEDNQRANNFSGKKSRKNQKKRIIVGFLTNESKIHIKKHIIGTKTKLIQKPIKIKYKQPQTRIQFI